MFATITVEFSLLMFVYEKPPAGIWKIWWMFRRNKRHTARSLFTSPQKPKLKWVFTAGVRLSSPAIGGDGTIYVASSDKKLYAVNPDGTMKWSFLMGDMVLSRPAHEKLMVGGT
jgi:hypothetical protein